MKMKKCKFCGKLFQPRSNRSMYCDGPHIRNCPICGKQYEETNNENLKRDPVCCSYQCRAIKTAQTSLKRYGCKAPGNNPEARNKAKQTMIKRFGVEYTLQSDELKKKVARCTTEKYGVDNVSKCESIIQKRHQTNMERYGGMYPFNRPESYAKQHKTIYEKYGVKYATLIPHVQDSSGKNRISKINIEFAKLLKRNNIQYDMEYRIHPRIFDFRIGNILIEINPTYTHNIIGNTKIEPTDKYYHRNKTQLAENNGYKCIHIWDWDDKDKIVKQLSGKTILDGSEFKVYRLEKKHGDQFLTDNDLHGTCRGQLLYLGLVKDDEIYQIMTFGKSKYDKSFNIQLMRMTTKLGYEITNGYDMLSQSASSEFGVNSCIAYADRSKLYNDEFEKLGMKLIRTTPPSLIWSKNSDYLYDSIVRLPYSRYTKEALLQSGWLPIYDCGQRVYVFE